MDIAGAKALKKRLGPKAVDETPSSAADVHDGAPPVYRWTGVSRPEPEAAADDDEPAAAASLFRRLALSFQWAADRLGQRSLPAPKPMRSL